MYVNTTKEKVRKLIHCVKFGIWKFQISIRRVALKEDIEI
jgi:hypothetical protein